ncbi:acylphosphatase [Corynebacterium silvaticum]|nr:acylphosphatase [Corynebacterium silvaticum]NON69336.1 acylphosphatase [Corynebacterium silvaticum]TFA94299.1 acylphosphatase [Corynebacterium silvaticum]TFA97370.1 acylphosphatase [Corynebacterium silvaticum]TNX85926.1 acylphosphatase [Corynebacterium silvaticum]
MDNGESRGAARQPEQVRLTAWVHGHVQGVGFRWWMYTQAMERGLAGSATNLVDGRVCVVAEGDAESCQSLLHILKRPDVDGRPGTVSTVVELWSEPKGVHGFITR